MVMKKIFIILFIILFPGIILAQEKTFTKIDIFVNDSFFEGELVNFSYKIDTNISDLKYMVRIDCDGGYPQKIPEEMILKKTEINSLLEYRDVPVSKEIESQNCKAIIELLNSDNNIVSEEFKINARTAIDSKLIFCEDSTCSSELKEIYSNKEVFIDVDSDYQSQFSIKIIKNNQIVDIVKLPSWYLFVPDGKYKLELITKDNGVKIKNNVSYVEVLSSLNILNEEKQIISDVDKINIRYYFYLLFLFIILIFLFIVYKVKFTK
jgi:hypothetical protein